MPIGTNPNVSVTSTGINGGWIVLSINTQTNGTHQLHLSPLEAQHLALTLMESAMRAVRSHLKVEPLPNTPEPE